MIELIKNLFPIFFPNHKKETVITVESEFRKSKPKPSKEKDGNYKSTTNRQLFNPKPKPPKES